MTTITRCPMCGDVFAVFDQPVYAPGEESGTLMQVGAVPIFTCHSGGCDWKGVTFSRSRVEFTIIKQDGDTCYVGFDTDNASTLTLIQRFSGVQDMENELGRRLNHHTGRFRIHRALLANLVGSLMMTNVIEVTI